MEEEEAEEQQEGGVSPEPNPASLPDQPRKTMNEATLNGVAEGQESEEEKVDENLLRLDIELLTPALKSFHQIREKRDIDKETMMNAKNKKAKGKDSKSTDKARDASREKKKERIYWEKMTKILTDQKLSVWRALDKSLGDYYQLLVDRQNLIEETGLLN